MVKGYQPPEPEKWMPPEKYIPKTETLQSLQLLDRNHNLGLTVHQAWILAEWCEKESEKITSALRDMVCEFEGDSGTGVSYWADKPVYRAAKEALGEPIEGCNLTQEQDYDRGDGHFVDAVL